MTFFLYLCTNANPMRLRLSFLLLLLPTVLSAQGIGEWLLHPTFSSATMVTEGYTFETGKFRTGTLAMLSAGFGSAGDPFRVNVSYDVLSSRFMTCEAIWQPSLYIGVHVGMQKMIFFVENTFSPNSLGMIGYSQAVSGLAGYSSDMTGINSRSRDVGISLQGALWPGDGYALVNYNIGVFNGNGYSFRDNNRAKDLQGRIFIQPAWCLKFSLGGMYGHYNLPETDTLAARHRLSCGVWFDNGKWFLRSENIYGITSDTRSDGIMALAGWWFRPRLLLAGRVDRFQRDVADPESAVTRADLCFSHMLTADGSINYRIQYRHTFYADPALQGSDALTLCLSFSFRRSI